MLSSFLIFDGYSKDTFITHHETRNHKTEKQMKVIYRRFLKMRSWVLQSCSTSVKKSCNLVIGISEDVNTSVRHVSNENKDSLLCSLGS